ncbi:MAG TPA: hypothetical protein GXZ60_09620 [Intrasporangiaceae bacterium]|nr:hypothetical protein [Intrasporangiaceae bacterium]
MHTAPSTRVDVYARDDAGTGRFTPRWLGCGSLIAPDVVLMHGQEDPDMDTDAEVVCVLSNDGGDVITGRVAAAADGSARAIGLDAPTGRPVRPTQPPTDPTRPLSEWVADVARQSGCSHHRPPGPPPDDRNPDRVRGRPWWCRLFPTLPGCR